MAARPSAPYTFPDQRALLPGTNCEARSGARFAVSFCDVAERRSSTAIGRREARDASTDERIAVTRGTVGVACALDAPAGLHVAHERGTKRLAVLVFVAGRAAPKGLAAACSRGTRVAFFTARGEACAGRWIAGERACAVVGGAALHAPSQRRIAPRGRASAVDVLGAGCTTRCGDVAVERRKPTLSVFGTRPWRRTRDGSAVRKTTVGRRVVETKRPVAAIDERRAHDPGKNKDVSRDGHGPESTTSASVRAKPEGNRAR